MKQDSSETLGKLAEALSKAQGEMDNASKDKTNPFFGSSYADLAAVWGACRQPLSKNGLAVVQSPQMKEGKLILITTLLHTSGEWMSSELPIQPVKQGPQEIGSCITYMRRFALSSLVGIAPAEKATKADVDDDDDGNAASHMEGQVREELMTQIHEIAQAKQIPADALKKRAYALFGTDKSNDLEIFQLKLFIADLRVQ